MLAVVANHFQPGRVTGGFVGVDVFFVISGFLISGIILRGLQAGSFTLGDFYARRVRRIFPALSLVLVASFITGWFALDPAAYADLGANAAAGAGFVSNLLLWNQTGYFASEALSKPLLHLWSLGIEEQYYAFWPLFLATLWTMRFRLVPIAAIAIASFALNAALSGSRPTAAFFSPAARIWELLVGSMIAYVALTRGEPIALLSGLGARDDATGRPVLERRLRELSAWLGILLIAVPVGILTEDSTFPGYWVLLPTVGAALLICAGPDTWINRTLLSNPVIVLIGLISYPLYLWHWPVLALIHIRAPVATRFAKAGELFGALFGVFIAAWLTYKFIETPIRRSRSGRVVAGLSLSQVLLFSCGLALVGLRGVPGRYDAPHLKLFAIARPSGTYGAAYRYEKTCLLSDEYQDEAALQEACDAVASTSNPSSGVLLWGDSFAAQLVPGIEATISKGTDFYEFTINGCPPLVASAGRLKERCDAGNRFTLKWIRQHKPRIVLLASRWNRDSQYRGVEATINTLKGLGIPRVVLIGMFAQYERSVPMLLIKELEHGGIPQRLQTPMMPALLALDSVLKTIAARSGAEFISPLATQCTPRGCIVTLDGSIESVTMWDTGHLTLVGSRFVVEQGLRPYLKP